MPGPKPLTVCRVCGQPRDPSCRMAFCTKHAKAFIRAQYEKRPDKRSKKTRLHEAYETLHVKARVGIARGITVVEAQS